jgi:small subunit ribosomal protein S6e
MAKLQLIISDPRNGSCKKIEVEGTKAQTFIGRKIGEVLDGSVADISGVRLMIKGGSDKDGTPMRPDVHGGVKTSILLSDGVGLHNKEKGIRMRKLVRGNTITEDIIQLNLITVPIE